MKKCKKILALLLSMTMVFSLAACGSNNEEPAPSQDQTSDDSNAEADTNADGRQCFR